MDNIKSKPKNQVTIVLTIFLLSFLYVASIILIFVGFNDPMWGVLLNVIPYVIPYFFIIGCLVLIFNHSSGKTKSVIDQAAIMNQVPVDMMPLYLQNPEMYASVTNSFMYLVNTMFGLAVILGSIFVSGDFWVIVVESIWGMILIVWSIRYLIKNKGFKLLKQGLLSIFD